MITRVIAREVRLAWRSGSEIASPLWFFLIVVSLFPLAIGADSPLLARTGPGIVWVAVLLSSLLALERLFRDDLSDGTLEQLVLMPAPFPWLVLGKVLGHWLTSGLPLVVLSPLAALFLSLNFAAWKALALTMLLGTPVLSLVGATGAALTAGLRRGGVLLTMLVLPLCTPVLIFACAAVDAAQSGLPIGGYLAILGAMLTASLTLTPFATAAALRISVQA